MPTKLVPIDQIRADAAAQPRVNISTEVVASYSDDMTLGAEFPPVVVFQEGDVYWLGDGFHRFYAARGVAKKIECDVHRGTLRDAILYSCGANTAHGHRRTNDDKRRAVLTLLRDEEWSQWSDHEIARRTVVHHTFVGRLRKDVGGRSLETSTSEDRVYASKHGTVSTMNVANIGGSKAPASAAHMPPAGKNAQPVEHKPAEPTARGTYGWMARALWDIERHIDSMPAPEEAARLFPDNFRNTMTPEKIAAMGDWLRSFAEAWSEIDRAA